MANDKTTTISSISEADLTTPTSTRRFALGQRLKVETDGSAPEKEYLYVKAGSGLTALATYLVTFSATAGSEWTTGTPATTAVAREFAIAPVAFTTAYYGWVQVKGICNATSTSDTVTGNCALAVNAAVTMSDAGNATFAATTVGYWLASRTGSGTSSLMLIGRSATI